MAVRHYKRKRDGATVYCASFYGPDGTRKVRKVAVVPDGATKTEHKRASDKAKHFSNTDRAQVESGTYKDPKTTTRRSLPFKVVVKKFLAGYRSRSGNMKFYKSRSKVWTRLLGDKLADKVTVEDVERLRRVRETEAGPGTVRKDLISLGTFFRWAKARKYVTENPSDPFLVTRPSEPPNRKDYLTPKEEVDLLKACPEWLRLPVLWAINTGMDRAEVVALSTRDIDREGKVVHAPRSKTGVDREIPFDTILESILDGALKVRQIRPELPERVFLGPNRKPIGINTAETTLQRAFAEAGITKPGKWKLLRHTYGSRAAMAGLTQAEIQALMGHTSPNTTARYMHLSPSHLREAAKRRAEFYPERYIERYKENRGSPEGSSHSPKPEAVNADRK